jgi:hypothetical protein
MREGRRRSLPGRREGNRGEESEKKEKEKDGGMC